MAWTPRSPFAHAVHLAGFEYDPAQDIIKSRVDAPIQSRAGFAWGIDIMGPVALMIIDCETFYFEYGSRMWLIELWKGQYGYETGGEIGVYHRPTDGATNEPPSETIKKIHRNRSLWFASSTDYKLNMSMKLYRDGMPFLHRGPEYHWWLTGFKWGYFSQPSQLSMEGVIHFKAKGMCDQFAAAMRATGYRPLCSGQSVAFTFRTPVTSQPKSTALAGPGQAANLRLVEAYRVVKLALRASSNDPNEFVLPPEWTKPVVHAAQGAAHQAVGIARGIQSGAAAAAARLQGRAKTVATNIQHTAAGAANRMEDRIDGAESAFRDVMAFFQRPRWR